MDCPPPNIQIVLFNLVLTKINQNLFSLFIFFKGDSGENKGLTRSDNDHKEQKVPLLFHLNSPFILTTTLFPVKLFLRKAMCLFGNASSLQE